MHPTLGRSPALAPNAVRCKCRVARFLAFFHASTFFNSDGVPPPASARVTQTVSQPKSKTKYVFDSQVSFLAKIFFSAWWFLVRKIRLFLAVALFKVKYWSIFFQQAGFQVLGVFSWRWFLRWHKFRLVLSSR